MFVKKNAKPELEPTRIPTALDVAWAAGVYEGEGSVRGYNNRSVIAQMCQKDPEMLYRLRDLFGGSVAEYANPGMKKTGRIFKWTAGGDKARIFFALIYPWMTARRKAQIETAKALIFMEGASPDGCSREQIVNHLAKYYENESKSLLRNMNDEQRKSYWREVARRSRLRRGMKPNRRGDNIVSIERKAV